jgi:hypothetical protein
VVQPDCLIASATKEANMTLFCKLLLWSCLYLLLATRVQAHDAHTGWQYPRECCSDGDCDAAIVATRNADGSLTVTTKHGTATFPANFPHRDSPDGLIHACFTPRTLYCLYLAAGL